MPRLPIPRGVYPSVLAISPAALAAKGIRLVLADLDNTLVAYRVTEPSSDVIAWRQQLRAHGIELFLLSNSRKPGRVEHFARALDVPFQGRSGKPKRAGYLRSMERMGCSATETVMVGDQIFTDTLGASNAGVIPLLVKPIRLAGNPGRYVRYAVETPFRMLGGKNPFV